MVSRLAGSVREHCEGLCQLSKALGRTLYLLNAVGILQGGAPDALHRRGYLIHPYGLLLVRYRDLRHGLCRFSDAL